MKEDVSLITWKNYSGIDSRAPTELVDVYTAYLKNELKFKGSISKSTLYDIPKPIKVKIKRKIKKKYHNKNG